MPPPRDRRPETLHPRNRHRGGLDFARLCVASPDLSRFIAKNEWGNDSIDFADPAAQKSLTTALLQEFYGVTGWDLPDGALCPSIPGRADYLHTAADLLASCNGGTIPRGAAVRLLDVGVGASCVYPLIGHSEYGWSFLGSDIEPRALASAQRILERNPVLRGAIELRLQPVRAKILEGLVRPGEVFDVTICNPPFHASAQAAVEGSRRKWKNLGKGSSARDKPVLNFGGQGAELWCSGGESAFVRRLVEESARLPACALWFSSLVSKSENLPAIERALQKARVLEHRTFELKQGQKTSRIVAWTFLDERQREAWRAARFATSPRAR